MHYIVGPLHLCRGPTHTVLHIRTAGHLTWKPKMHQNSWWPGFAPDPTGEGSQRSRKPPIADGRGGKPGTLAQPFGLRVSESGLASPPAMLISFRRHWRIQLRLVFISVCLQCSNCQGRGIGEVEPPQLTGSTFLALVNFNPIGGSPLPP